MDIEIRIWNFTIINLEIYKYFTLDILEYNEISLLTILLNKNYKRIEVLTFGVTF